MLIFLSLTGIFLSVILLYFNVRKFASSIYLGVFFFLISLYGLIQYSILYSESKYLVAFFLFNFGFLTYLTGPMLYLYFRSILTDKYRLKINDLWHLLPMFLFLAGVIPYILTPWSYKLEIAAKMVEDSNYVGNTNNVPIYKWFPISAVFLSRPILVMGYALWSAGMLILFLKQNRESSVLTHQKYMTKWLTVLLGFLCILAISQFIILDEAFSNKNLKAFFTLNALQILSGLGLTGLLISPFFFPGILYGLPRLPEQSENQITSDQNPQTLVADIRKTKISLEDEYLHFIEDKTETCMEELQPYLQPECNLAHFSKITNIPVHHLGYYFREIRKQPFNDFRNGWRVKHAKKLISEGKGNELSIEGIALLSGFATRNTFFTAFKKVEGISPGAYLAQFV